LIYLQLKGINGVETRRQTAAAARTLSTVATSSFSMLTASALVSCTLRAAARMATSRVLFSTLNDSCWMAWLLMRSRLHVARRRSHSSQIASVPAQRVTFFNCGKDVPRTLPPHVGQTGTSVQNFRLARGAPAGIHI
jgi:hypothetical protein